MNFRFTKGNSKMSLFFLTNYIVHIWHFYEMCYKIANCCFFKIFFNMFILSCYTQNSYYYIFQFEMTWEGSMMKRPTTKYIMTIQDIYH